MGPWSPTGLLPLLNLPPVTSAPHPRPLNPLQAKGARLVSVTSIPSCPLDQACDLAVTLPLLRELCPFNLAPVTSTSIQMLFGDTVAIALMQVGRCLFCCGACLCCRGKGQLRQS